MVNCGNLCKPTLKVPGHSVHLDKEVTSESQTGGDLSLGTGLIIVLWFCGLLAYPDLCFYWS